MKAPNLPSLMRQPAGAAARAQARVAAVAVVREEMPAELGVERFEHLA